MQAGFSHISPADLGSLASSVVGFDGCNGFDSLSNTKQAPAEAGRLSPTGMLDVGELMQTLVGPEPRWSLAAWRSHRLPFAWSTTQTDRHRTQMTTPKWLLAW